MLPFQVFYFYEWLEQHNDPGESLPDRVQLLCIASISFLTTRPRFWQTNDIRAKKTSRKRCREHPSTRVLERVGKEAMQFTISNTENLVPLHFLEME